MSKEIGIIGLGKMGAALAGSFCEDYSVQAFEASEASLENIPNHLRNKISFHPDIPTLLEIQCPIILAVKPHQVRGVISQITGGRPIISIAAGVSLERLDLWRPARGPTIRVMPNTPIQVGMGMSCLMGNSDVSEELMQEVESMFSKNGEVLILNNEDHFHAVTAISGSGPALVYLFLQALEDSGVSLGLDRNSARKLACQTTLGAAHLVKMSEKSPQELIHDVTSPGGTTIAALGALKKEGFEAALHSAIQGAEERSRDILHRLNAESNES